MAKKPPKDFVEVHPTVPYPYGKLYEKGSYRAIVAQEPKTHTKGKTELLWHLSVAHPSHLPPWDVMEQARATLLPENRTFGIILPKPEEYVNVHNFCFIYGSSMSYLRMNNTNL